MENNVTWYLDNDASNHMIGDRNMTRDRSKFVQLDTKVTGDVRLEMIPKWRSSKDKSTYEEWTEGKDGGQVSIDLKQDDRLVAKIAMISNRMFKLNVKTAEETCLQACINDSSWIWHMRFGHLNSEDFKMLGEKYIVRGVSKINHPNQLCEACLPEKHGRKSFPKESLSKATKPLQLVHTDVFGPSIHNHSFKTHVEKESGLEIKALRTNRGGEFTSNEFKKIL
ncbi:UNVERIFIED_CONTAM: hypothetical protein Sangu_2765000 [Sesamum angustifolium]|uniref:GAG-pre-integrase domain-containing protein n=1 Tax=Sesamum angustifolium TaxID=2727405 RepID=A0AAW2IUJ4_9LAMI